MLNIKIILLLIIICLAIIIKLPNNNYLNSTIKNSDPGEYMYNIYSYKYNNKGSLTASITANYWQFFSKQHNSIITNPVIKLYRENNNSYTIIANKAYINQEKLIKLADNVKIMQYKHDGTDGLNLVTSYLELNTNTNIAYTPEHVTITKTNLTITATGMRANLTNNQVDLHHNVSTKYEPINYQ